MAVPTEDLQMQINELEAILNQTRQQLFLTQLESQEKFSTFSGLLNETNDNVELVKAGTNTSWLLLTGFLVFWMQAGFAMYEGGAVSRPEAILHILNKNFVNVGVTVMAWYLTGYGIAFGDGYGTGGNAGIGDSYFATYEVNNSPTLSFHHWYFQYCFAAAAATIVSGSISERVKEGAFFVFAFFVCAWIYPMAVHWVWSTPGILSSFRPVDDLWLGNGVLDFAGSLVIHTLGGVCSFWASLISGPRYKRWDKHYIEKQVFAPQSVTWMTQGTLILWLGWFGFNCGSTIVIVGYTETAGLVAVNTILSSGMASLTAAIATRIMTGHWDTVMGLNGALAGLVMITGSCAFIEPWCAVLFGFVGAWIYLGGAKLLRFVQIDDVVEACVVHAFCGIASIFGIGLFATDHNMRLVYGRDEHYGAFMGGGGEQLAIQVIGICVIVLWSSLWAVLFWGIARKLNLIRLSKTREKQMFQERLDQLARGKINLQTELPKDMQFNINPDAKHHADSDDRVAVDNLSESG